MIRSKIVATGAGIPEQVITNDDLTKIVDTSDEWISQRTGIKERHISGGEDLSFYAAKAAKQILDRAGVPAEDVELIVVATVTADYGTPSAACMVQKAIGASRAVAFDVTAACSGFLYGVSVADKFIRCGVYRNALVIGGEILSKIVDWTDRSTCVLFGDGAAGVLLERTDSEEGVLLEELGAQGDMYEVLTEGHVPPANAFNQVEPLKEQDYVYMDGRAVFKFATKKIVSSVSHVLEEAHVTPDEIKYFIPHQANARIVEVAAKKLKVPYERFYMNIEHYGNTSAASIPIALNEMSEKGLLEKGDKIVLCGFGGGLSWGTILIQW
jgi:3-oxoacyl-[acyl-carrier-protein] synthase-3